MTEKKSIERIDFIDVARGITILLVVLGHAIGDVSTPLNRWLLSFHMPMFFFITGYLMRVQILDLKYIGRKSRTILIPQCVMAVLTIAFSIVAESILLQQIKVSEVRFMDAILFWFLPVLFVSQLIYQSIINVFDKRDKWLYVVFLLNLGLVFLMDYLKIQTLVHIEIIPMAVLFLSLGYIYRSHIAKYNATKLPRGWLLLLMIPVSVLISSINTPVLMYKNYYGNLLLFFLGAIVGITIILEVSKYCESNNVFAYIGKNSILFYTLHVVLLKGLHGVASIVTDSAINNYDYPYYWFFYLLTVIIILIASVVINATPLKRLFGKN